MNLRMACGAILILGLGACTGTSSATNEQKASARAAVDVIRDCNKPWFDTVSASDHTTVVKGMTPVEREVCSTTIRPDTDTGH